MYGACICYKNYFEGIQCNFQLHLPLKEQKPIQKNIKHFKWAIFNFIM